MGMMHAEGPFKVESQLLHEAHAARRSKLFMIYHMLGDVKKKLIEHPARFRHTLGVYETALKLAEVHGADLHAVV